METIECFFYDASDIISFDSKIPFEVSKDNIKEDLKLAYWRSLDILQASNLLGIEYGNNKHMKLSREAILSPFGDVWAVVEEIMESKANK